MAKRKQTSGSRTSCNQHFNCGNGTRTHHPTTWRMWNICYTLRIRNVCTTSHTLLHYTFLFFFAASRTNVFLLSSLQTLVRSRLSLEFITRNIKKVLGNLPKIPERGQLALHRFARFPQPPSHHPHFPKKSLYIFAYISHSNDAAATWLHAGCPNLLS